MQNTPRDRSTDVRRSDRDTDGFAPGVLVRWATRVLSLVGLVMATILARISLQAGDAVFGCGGLPQFDCHHVLTSPWAFWLGIPVSVPAVACYATILVCTFLIAPGIGRTVRETAWALLSMLAITAAGAAVWFVGLMLFAVEGFCLYCLITHTCGLTIGTLVAWQWLRRKSRNSRAKWIVVLQPSPREGTGRRSLADSPGRSLWTRGWFVMTGVLLALGTLIGAQVAFPAKQHQVERIADVLPDDDVPQLDPLDTPDRTQQPDDDPGDSMSPATPTIGDPVPPIVDDPDTPPVENHQPRNAAIKTRDGQLELDPLAHPLVGDPKAKYVLVKMFDYTCRHCQKLHLHLEEARRRYGDQIAIVVLPIPMNTDCNPHIAKTHADHRRACEYARLALAVWIVDPEKFEQYHHFLLATPRPAIINAATDRAIELVGKEALERTRDGLAVAGRVQDYTTFYNRVGRGSLPKLFAGKHVITGETADADTFCDELERMLDLRPQNP